jgi:hypothetical protein
MSHRPTNEHRSSKVTHVSKRRKRKQKSHSFPKVIPVINETKETIVQSAPSVSQLKITTNISVQNSLPSAQSITNPRKSTDSSLIDDSVKQPSEKQKE